MANTHFSGPVISANGFGAGESSTPILVTTAGTKVSSAYVSSSATGDDTRLSYEKLTFTGAGSGETYRAYTVVTAASTAPGGTVNGAHISLDINGSGTISGAANALRATLGGTSTAPGGTIAAIQADSNFASGGTWTHASFIRCTNSGTGTVQNLLNVPTAMVAVESAAVVSHTLRIVAANGTPYYLMVSDTA